jgi:adenylate cyclase
LFTDLVGFTSISEKTDPQALMDWINTYLNSVAKMIMENGGVIDDYFGDGIKANFGVPFPRTTEAEIRQDAINAVDCALAMEQEIVRLNAEMQGQGRPPLKMRVGIFTGTVVAGSLGSAERLKYTTMGDTVNTASRLESFEKDLPDPEFAERPCRILIGEQTLRRLNQQFETRKFGEVILKGKDESVTVHRVVGRVEGSARQKASQVTEAGAKRLVTANESDS